MNEYIRVFRALSDPKRVRILEILCKSEECACVLLDDLDISQPTLSHHMKILCESGIVAERQNGRWKYYRIDEEGCRYAQRLLKSVAEKDMEPFLKILSGIYNKMRASGFSGAISFRGVRVPADGEACCGEEPR